jgi:hypothetical protein
MNARSTFPSDPDEPPLEAVDLDLWGREAVADRDARRQARLDELAELALRLAQRVARAGEDADEAMQPAELASLSMAFGRVSRAVRLTEALADRLDHPPPPKAGAAISDDPMDDPAEARRVRISANGKLAKIFVNRAVEDAIEAEARERGDGFDAEPLLEALDRRIGGLETIEEFGTTPWAEMAARICAELGVPFDPRDGWPEPGTEAEAGTETHGPAPPGAAPARRVRFHNRTPPELAPAGHYGRIWPPRSG